MPSANRAHPSPLTFIHRLIQGQRQASAAVELRQVGSTGHRLFDVLQPSSGCRLAKLYRLLQRPTPVGVCSQRHTGPHRGAHSQHRRRVLQRVGPPPHFELQGGKGLALEQGRSLGGCLFR
jgi:hypothetical protein